MAHQVEREDQRKASLEARGIAVVTTSAALATLLLGLSTLGKESKSSVLLAPEAHGSVRVALALFALGALVAVVTNVPLGYREATVSGLRKLLNDSWDDSVKNALATVAANQLVVLESARFANGVKAGALVAAIGFEVAATILIAHAVWTVL